MLTDLTEKKQTDIKKRSKLGLKTSTIAIILLIGLTTTGITYGAIQWSIKLKATRLAREKESQIRIHKELEDYELDENARLVDGQGLGEKDKVIKELNEAIASGMINISMNMSPVFKNGSSEGNLLIVNEPINVYPQVVEIYLDDTGELIYKSGLIPVGNQVEMAPLNVKLSKGEYECTAYFSAIDTDAKAPIGTAGAKITVNVVN